VGLVWRILAIVGLANFTVLLIFVALATMQFDALLSGLIRDRLEVIVGRARSPFASVVELGLPFSTVRNGRAVLEASRQTDPAIIEMSIFQLDGKVAHSTAKSNHMVVPERWMSAPRTGPDLDLFHFETKSAFIVGADIGETSEPSGVLIIVYSKRQALDQVRAMAAKLAFVAGVVMATTLVVGAIALRFALMEHQRVFHGILKTFDRFERAFWRGTRTSRKPKNVKGLGFETDRFWDLLWQSEREYEARKNQTPNMQKDTNT